MTQVNPLSIPRDRQAFDEAFRQAAETVQRRGPTIKQQMLQQHNPIGDAAAMVWGALRGAELNPTYGNKEFFLVKFNHWMQLGGAAPQSVAECRQDGDPRPPYWPPREPAWPPLPGDEGWPVRFPGFPEDEDTEPITPIREDDNGSHAADPGGRR